MKKLDFIIFYEHVARELESDKLLYNYLCKIGYTGVILPIHFNRYINLLRYQPKLLIMPFFYNQTREVDLYKSIYPDVQILNLHSEQISSKLSMGHMLPQHEKTKNCFHISWGEDFAKQLHEAGVSNEKIFVTGSLRNDLAYKYQNVVNEKIILIPTSFSLSFVTLEEKAEFIKNKNFIDEQHTQDIIDFTTKTRDAFLKTIYEFSKRIPDGYKIILRPHPHVGITEYKDCFFKLNSLPELPSNITISREGSIQSAIASSEYVISQGSTSALEAAIMKKKTLLLVPYSMPDEMYCEFMDYFPTATNCDELLELFNRNDVDSYLKDYIYRTYYKTDGYSYVRISKLVQEILKDNRPYRVNNKKKLKILVKAFLIDLPKLFLLHTGLLGKLFKFYRGITEDSVSILHPDLDSVTDKTVKCTIEKTREYCLVNA